MPDSRPLRPGDPERLGGYRLVGLLGEGGQGVVYLGERVDGGEERFAVKLLRTHLSGDARARRYFAREVAAAQRIDPSFTARIVEADVEGRTPYLVSEYVDGRPLSDAVREEGPVTGAELHRLAVGTLNALAAIHQANVVHRDFKPSNVLLSADRPRVIDFGIARALDATMSVSSGVVGTPAYMAPEQLNGQTITPAVDVFAWGATMVFAATGAPPFGQDSIPRMMHRILTADPVIGNIPSPLRELVWYCLYKDPTQRPGVGQVLAGLAEATAPPVFTPPPWTGWSAAPGPALPPAAPPPPSARAEPSVRPEPSPWDDTPGGAGTRPPDGRRRRRLPVIAAAAGVVLVAASAVVVTLLRPGHTPAKKTTTTTLAAGAALSGVVSPSTAKGGTLRLLQPLDFDSLDPGNMYYTGSWNFSRLYARSLLTYRGSGTAGLRPVPDLATGAGEASADLKTWTYRLRTGVRFEDGTPVTAKDVRYAVARTFAADVLPGGPSYFRDLLDTTYPGPYKNHDLAAFTGVTTPDDQTVVFHLKRPYADFDHLAALPQTAPVPAAKDTGATYKNHPVATGPYRIQTYVPGKSVSLVRNPMWRPDGIRTQLPDRVEVTIGPDADTVDRELLAGQGDLNPNGNGLADAARTRALADPALAKYTDTMTSGFLHFVALSTKVAPFDNVHCRMAVQYAVDRAAVRSADGGSADLATDLAPPTIAGRQPFDLYPQSADRAKQELAACGRPSGFATKLAIRQARPKDTAMAQALQQALARVGVTVTVQQYPVVKFYSDTAGDPAFVHKNGLGMILSTWGPDYPAASGFFPLLVDGRQILPSSNPNLAELDDHGVENLIDQISHTGDQRTREGLTAQLDRAVMGTAALVPLFYDRLVLYRGPRLTNASVSPVYDGYDLTRLGVG